RPQPHAAKKAKGSRLVDSIWRTNALGAAALGRMDFLAPARNNCPDRACPPALSLDKGSIVTQRHGQPMFLHRLPRSCRYGPSLAARSHIRIIRPAPALGRNPGDVLIGIFDVASFAMNAILRVDHETG